MIQTPDGLEVGRSQPGFRQVTGNSRTHSSGVSQFRYINFIAHRRASAKTRLPGDVCSAVAPYRNGWIQQQLKHVLIMVNAVTVAGQFHLKAGGLREVCGPAIACGAVPAEACAAAARYLITETDRHFQPVLEGIG